MGRELEDAIGECGLCALGLAPENEWVGELGTSRKGDASGVRGAGDGERSWVGDIGRCIAGEAEGEVEPGVGGLFGEAERAGVGERVGERTGVGDRCLLLTGAGDRGGGGVSFRFTGGGVTETLIGEVDGERLGDSSVNLLSRAEDLTNVGGDDPLNVGT